MSELVVVEPSIDIQKYTRAMEMGRRASEAFDRSVLDAVESINKLEKATDKMTGGKLEIKIDTSGIDKAVTDLELIDGATPDVMVVTDTSTLDSAESSLNALNGATPDVMVDVDSSELNKAESDIKSLDGSTPDVMVIVDDGELESAQTVINSIAGATPDVTVIVDSGEIDKAEGKLKNIDGSTPDVTITADTSGVDQIEDELQNIQRAAHIELVIAYAPDALDLISKLTGLGGQIELNVAGSTFSASTGGAEIDEETINRIYAITGKTREEIALAAAAVFNLTGDMNNLGDDTVSAFQVAQGGGEEFKKVIDAQAQLVRNGLAPNFQAAADIIANGFNNNANRAGDFLDTIIEYSPNFKAMGLSGEQAVAGIVDALSQGTFNADKFGDVVKETGILINEALGDTTSAKYKILQDLDLVDEAELLNQGQMGFDEFFNGFKAASANLSPAERNTAITELFGTPAEDMGFDIFANLDFTPLEDTTGKAEELFTLANDNLPSAFSELGRTIETEVLHKIVDLQGLLDGVTEKIHIITGLLQNGTALPEALEIALEAPGLADTINTFASTANGLILDFLLGVADILQGLNNLAAAESIRGAVGDAAVGQLAFDLQLADNGVEFQAAIATALRRGVDEAELSGALLTATNEFIDSGRLDLGQQMIDSINSGGLAEVAAGLTYPAFSVPFEITPEMSPEEIQRAATEAVDTYVATSQPQWAGVSDMFKIKPVIQEVDTVDAEAALANARDAITEFETANTGAADTVGFVSDQMALMTTGTLPEWREEVGYTTEDISTLDKDSKIAIANVVDNAQLAGESFTVLARTTSRATDEAGEDLDQLSTDTGDAGASALLLAENTTLAMTGVSEATTEHTTIAGEQLDALAEQTGLASNSALTYMLAVTESMTGVSAITRQQTTLAGDDLVKLGETTDEAGLRSAVLLETVNASLPRAAAIMDEEIAKMILSLNALRDAANEAGGAVGGVGSVSGGGGNQSPDPNRGGGGSVTAQSAYMTGEGGRELFIPGVSGSILNNRSTEALLAGYVMGVGGGGGTTNNTNIYVNIYQNNQGMAARAGSDAQLTNKIRGF